MNHDQKKRPVPPGWAERLLERYGPSDSLEEALGDLNELYAHWVQTEGEDKARRRYAFNVLRLLRPFDRKRKVNHYLTPTSPAMLRSYLNIAFRNLLRHKAFSFINVAGLSVGMAVAILIGLWVWDEFSFDRYHRNHDRLARVMATQTDNDGARITFPNIVVPLENELRTKYAGDFQRLSLTWTSTNVLAVGDKKISRSGRWAQPDLPEMLTLPLRKGSYSAFKDPSSILLSQSVATALFGNADPVNKVVRVDNRTDMKVADVYEDLPRNTTFYETKFLLPWDNKANGWNTQTAAWDDHGCELFVQVNDRVDFDQTTAKIKGITQPHVKGSNEQTLLHPMEQWHLYSEFKNGIVDGGRIQLVWLFGIIGGFVLLLACINFMNLSTARSEKRAKEVGIRKAVGSARGQLIGQFLGESLLVAFLAFILAIFLVQVSLPFFNGLADKAVFIPWNTPWFWLLTLGFTLFTGLVSGSYPAFYLSGFKPINVLKGTFRAGRLASLPRKVLVVLQFTVSITLIIGTLIVFRQIQFAKSRPVGYTREGLITVVMNTPELYQRYDALRRDLIQTGAADEMAQSNSSPTQIWSNNSGFDWQGKDPNADPLFGTIAVTHDFGRTVGWEITEGRDFSRAHPTDSGAFILNESAVKLSGLKNPVGKTMKWNDKDHLITGVVKDMVMDSPYQPTVPTIFHMEYGWVNLIVVRIKPDVPLRQALSKIEPVFRKYNPGSPFDYQFTDEEYAKKFSDEERIGHLATFFATLAIFISGLG
ncbi:MAG: ABC transporter permease, partial [Ferruginibacter sp.]|nr:ABC transporter permease [Cytophagales bacterium]